MQYKEKSKEDKTKIIKRQQKWIAKNKEKVKAYQKKVRNQKMSTYNDELKNKLIKSGKSHILRIPRNLYNKIWKLDLSIEEVDKLELDNFTVAAIKKLRKNRMRKRLKRSAKRVKEYIFAYKLNNPCIKCGEKDPACLVFHHRDPHKKLGDVASLRKNGLKRVRTEIDKCDVLCSNCHLKLHFYGTPCL